MHERNRHQRSEGPSRALEVSLWVAQVLLFLVLAGGAIWKVATPRDEIAAKMAWVGQVPLSFFYTTAVFDFLGGVGVLVPALTRIRPQLTYWAALGSGLLMVAAIIFHTVRGEASDTPFNYFVLALACLVFWGRRYRALILQR